MLCNAEAAATLNWAGKSGLKTPVETFPRRSAVPSLRETIDREGEESIALTSGQESCTKATSVKSRGCAAATGTTSVSNSVAAWGGA